MMQHYQIEKAAEHLFAGKLIGAALAGGTAGLPSAPEMPCVQAVTLGANTP